MVALSKRMLAMHTPSCLPLCGTVDPLVYGHCQMRAGIACWYSAGLGIERLRVRVSAGAAGEFYSRGLTSCADSYSVSVPPPCYRSGT